MGRWRAGLLAASFAAAVPGVAAQETGSEPRPLSVGAEAPDFELVGATRFGILKQPVRLGDFRGKTVVVAFFYRARSPG